MSRRLRVRSSVDVRLNAPVALSLTAKAVPAIMNGEFVDMQAARRARLAVGPVASEAPVADLVTCNGCGCECARETADVIHDHAQYLLFTQDYSAEYHDLYCPSCLAWIHEEYQPRDAADDAYDAWTDHRAERA